MHQCRFLVVLLIIVSQLGCARQTDEKVQDSIAHVIQSAISIIGSQSTSVEGATSPLALFAGCSYTTARGNCSGTVRTVNWNNCSFSTMILSGLWQETFNSSTSCTNFTNTGGLANAGDSVVRKTANTKITFSSGATLRTDTNGGKSWDNTTIAANGITITQGAGSTRTIVLDGVHRELQGPLGVKWFDHFITGTFTVTGNRTSGNRTITSGTVTVYHNLGRFTAQSNLNGVTWGSSLCCYPTQGSVMASLSGSLSGFITLNFAPGATTCGSATYTDTNNVSTTVTLNQCP